MVIKNEKAEGTAGPPVWKLSPSTSATHVRSGNSADVGKKGSREIRDSHWTEGREIFDSAWAANSFREVSDGDLSGRYRRYVAERWENSNEGMISVRHSGRVLDRQIRYCDTVSCPA